MTWIIISIVLYLTISAAALTLICEKDRDAYFDIRNIITAVLWWIVLIWLGIVWSAKRIAYKKKEVESEGN